MSSGSADSTGLSREIKVEIDDFVLKANRLMWSGREAHRYLQSKGVQLGPARFYSQIPMVSEIEQSFEYAGVNSSLGPYWDDELFSLDKVRLFFQEAKIFSQEFKPPVHGNEKNPTSFFLNNPLFSSTDAVAYYCMIRKYRPSRIVEIGSGFSSLIAQAGLAANGHGELICIEPFPLPWLHERVPRARHIEFPIQSIGVEEINDMLGKDGMLFIDSTHTVKIGSDCLWIYLKLLPAITQNVLVHAHDVYLPFGMPADNAADLHMHWTEQYLLYAYLLNNSRTEFVFGSALAHALLPSESQEFTDGYIRSGGASFWFTQRGQDS